MKTREVTVVNPTGLHARPAAEFVKLAASFKSSITVRNLTTQKEVNAKSIVMLLTLALSKGSQMSIAADGEDEEEAVTALAALIEGGFGEV
jgi:phosphocarrier protein